MNIEQLKKEVKSIETSLNELKKNIGSLSEVDKKKQTEELINKVEKAKQKINNRITELSEKTDDNSKKEIEEAKQLLESLESSVELQREIIENKTDKKGDWWDKDKKEWKVEWAKDWNEKWKKLPEQDGKNIFWKSWDWIKDQRNDVWNKEKWKEEWFTNALRTAWFVATWVGAIALTVKWIKKLWDRAFWDDEEWESDEEETETKLKKKKKKEKSSDDTPFWDTRYWKALKWTGIWTWVYYIAHWLKTGKWNIKDFGDWKAEWENPLTIEASLPVAAWEVNCWNIDENMFRQNFDNWIEYDKGSQTIQSYWESTKINEKNKCIVWLEKVKFKTNVELVHAANIVNCLKYNLRWCWSAKDAFAETGNWWDIAFSFSVEWANEVLSGSNSDFWQNTLTAVWSILWITAWVATKSAAVWIWWTLWLWAAWYFWWQALDDNSSLGKCCSTIKDGDNFTRFISYLNSIKEWGKSIWLPGKQGLEDENKSPIQKYINEVITELDNTNMTEIPDGKVRDLKAEQDPHNPNRYKISSYGQHTYITISWNITMLSNWQVDPSSIKSITIEKYSENDIWWDLKLDFPHTKEGLKECLRVVNLSNMFRKKYGWYWWEKYPFFFNLMPYVQWNSMPIPIIPFIPPVNSAYDSGFWVDTNWEWNLSNKWECVIKNESLQKDCPTLLKDLAKNKKNSQSYFEDQLNNKEDGSSFIKFLNWMRNIASQNYWTNWQNNS